MNRDLELKWLQTQWTLGLLSIGKLPEIATTLLCDGIESKALIELAGLTRKEPGAAELFEQALEELGCSPLEPIDAVRYYAKAISASIVASEITPLEGANRIWRAVLHVDLHGFHELDPFIYAASEIPDRPWDRKFFEDAIVEEARRWTSLDDLNARLAEPVHMDRFRPNIVVEGSEPYGEDG